MPADSVTEPKSRDKGTFLLSCQRKRNQINRTRETSPCPVNKQQKALWKIRNATGDDHWFIRKMMFEAVFIPEGQERPGVDVIDLPELQKYTWDWMKPTDSGCIAIAEGKPVGAAWSRLFTAEEPGYGYVAEGIPEVSMAVDLEWRGKGVGSDLLDRLCQILQEKGYRQISLSVDQRNPAVSLYRRKGFHVHEVGKTDYVMTQLIPASEEQV